ncbi:3-dehydroquinate synthase II [Thalassobacillus sp. C254]|uniref:3-dehydroquinate synthase II n=1 Tax=Thalassobacillus sp. C254 TaxID=1225341 RepID=UPI0006CFE639|nr:3-dehydroquinate synthase II [Thalassobacillus sp. C254]
MNSKKNKVEYIAGEVISIKAVGKGTRVCVDCADELSPEEGMLVGNTGDGYILVLSENRNTETYPSRAFRVNCGAVHQYIYEGENTKYLSELRGGEQTPVFSLSGEPRIVPLGRVKAEQRDLLRVECRVQNKIISATLQDADSVQLAGEEGNSVPVQQLASGDRVLCMVDEPGRHLGEKIKEEIREY